MPHKLTKILSLLLCFVLIFQQSGFTQIAGELDLSSHFFALRNTFMQDRFRPLHLRYLSYDPAANNFNLLLDKGDFVKGLFPQGANPKDSLQQETKTLLNYFFIGISLPNEAFWVNLRPDSPGNIIDPELAETDVGKILLEADLQLKKDTANFTSPQTPEGKDYWDKLYKKAEEIYGSENITIPTLTRPWIVPDEIIIRESSDNAYIYKATLKVMLEQDYLKDSSTYSFPDQRSKALNEYSSQLIRETIIPKLTKEINSSKRYAPLRQVYYSLILAQWFKQKFYGKSGVYSYLIDRHKLDGLTSKTSWSKTTYFNAYKTSFQQGEYNIKEPRSTPYGQSIRSYMSGGMDLGKAVSSAITHGVVQGNKGPGVGLLISPHGLGINFKGGAVSSPFDLTIEVTAPADIDTQAGIEQPSTAASPVKPTEKFSAQPKNLFSREMASSALQKAKEINFAIIKRVGMFFLQFTNKPEEEAFVLEEEANQSSFRNFLNGYYLNGTEVDKIDKRFQEMPKALADTKIRALAYLLQELKKAGLSSYYLKDLIVPLAKRDEIDTFAREFIKFARLLPQNRLYDHATIGILQNLLTREDIKADSLMLLDLFLVLERRVYKKREHSISDISRILVFALHTEDVGKTCKNFKRLIRQLERAGLKESDYSRISSILSNITDDVRMTAGNLTEDKAGQIYTLAREMKKRKLPSWFIDSTVTKMLKGSVLGAHGMEPAFGQILEVSRSLCAYLASNGVYDYHGVTNFIEQIEKVSNNYVYAVQLYKELHSSLIKSGLSARYRKTIISVLSSTQIPDHTKVIDALCRKEVAQNITYLTRALEARGLKRYYVEGIIESIIKTPDPAGLIHDLLDRDAFVSVVEFSRNLEQGLSGNAIERAVSFPAAIYQRINRRWETDNEYALHQMLASIFEIEYPYKKAEYLAQKSQIEALVYLARGLAQNQFDGSDRARIMPAFVKTTLDKESVAAYLKLASQLYKASGDSWKILKILPAIAESPRAKEIAEQFADDEGARIIIELLSIVDSFWFSVFDLRGKDLSITVLVNAPRNHRETFRQFCGLFNGLKEIGMDGDNLNSIAKSIFQDGAQFENTIAAFQELLNMLREKGIAPSRIATILYSLIHMDAQKRQAAVKGLLEEDGLLNKVVSFTDKLSERKLISASGSEIAMVSGFLRSADPAKMQEALFEMAGLIGLGFGDANAAMFSYKVSQSKDPLRCAQATVAFTRELIALGMPSGEELIKVLIVPFESKTQDPLEIIDPLLELVRALKALNANKNAVAQIASLISKQDRQAEIIQSCTDLIGSLNIVGVYKGHIIKIVEALLAQPQPEDIITAFIQLGQAIQERKGENGQAVTVILSTLSESASPKELAEQLTRDKDLRDHLFDFVKRLGSINLGSTGNVTTGVMMMAIPTDALQALVAEALRGGDIRKFTDAVDNIVNTSKEHDSRLLFVSSLAKSETIPRAFIYSLGSEENSDFLKSFMELLSKQKSPERFILLLLRQKEQEAISRALIRIFSAFSEEEAIEQAQFIDQMVLQLLNLPDCKERAAALSEPKLFLSWKKVFSALGFPDKIIPSICAGLLDEALKVAKGDAGAFVKALLEEKNEKIDTSLINEVVKLYLVHVKFWGKGVLSALKKAPPEVQGVFSEFLVVNPGLFLINLEPILENFNPLYSGVSGQVRKVFDFFNKPAYLIMPILDRSLDGVLDVILKGSSQSLKAFTQAVLRNEKIPSELLYEAMRSYFSNSSRPYDQEILELIKTDSKLKQIFVQCLTENISLFLTNLESFVSTYNDVYGGCVNEIRSVFTDLGGPRHLIAPIIEGNLNGALNVIFQESGGDVNVFTAKLLVNQKAAETIKLAHLEMYLTRISRWDVDVMKAVKADNELVAVLKQHCLVKPSEFFDNLETMISAFNPQLQQEAKYINDLRTSHWYIPSKVFIEGVLYPERSGQLSALIDFILKENNATLINEKRVFLEQFFNANMSLEVFELIDGFMRNHINRAKKLEFIRGLNGLLRNKAVKADDSPGDWEILLNHYIFSDVDSGKKRFGYLANRQLVLLHRALLQEKPLDSQELSAFKLDELGIAATATEGIRQIEVLIKKIMAKIIEERNIDVTLLDNPVIDGVIGGITGFYTASWGHGSSGGLKLKAFIENTQSLMDKGLIPTLDEAYKQEYDLLDDGSGRNNEFFVRTKAKSEFNPDTYKNYPIAASFIRQGAVLSEKSPKEQLAEFRLKASELVSKKVTELQESLRDVSLETNKRSGLEKQQEICLNALAQAREATSLLDLSQGLVKVMFVKGIQEIIALSLLAQTFSRPEHQTLKEELMAQISQELSYEFLSKVVELKNDVIKDHILEKVNKKTKLPLLSCLPFGAFEDELKRSEALLKEGVFVKSFADNQVLGMFAPDIGDACYSRQPNFVTRTQPSKIVPIIFYTGDGLDVEFVGSMLILENKIEGKPVLILRAINPNDEFLSRYSAEDFVNNAIKYAERIASSKGIKTIVAPLASVGSLSNRSEVRTAFLKFSEGKRLNLEEAEDFNGYSIQHGAVERVISRYETGNGSAGSAIEEAPAVVSAGSPLYQQWKDSVADGASKRDALERVLNNKGIDFRISTAIGDIADDFMEATAYVISLIPDDLLKESVNSIELGPNPSGLYTDDDEPGSYSLEDSKVYIYQRSFAFWDAYALARIILHEIGHGFEGGLSKDDINKINAAYSLIKQKISDGYKDYSLYLKQDDSILSLENRKAIMAYTESLEASQFTAEFFREYILNAEELREKIQSQKDSEVREALEVIYDIYAKRFNKEYNAKDVEGLWGILDNIPKTAAKYITKDYNQFNEFQGVAGIFYLRYGLTLEEYTASAKDYEAIRRGLADKTRAEFEQWKLKIASTNQVLYNKLRAVIYNYAQAITGLFNANANDAEPQGILKDFRDVLLEIKSQSNPQGNEYSLAVEYAPIVFGAPFSELSANSRLPSAEALLRRQRALRAGSPVTEEQVGLAERFGRSILNSKLLNAYFKVRDFEVKIFEVLGVKKFIRYLPEYKLQLEVWKNEYNGRQKDPMHNVLTLEERKDKLGRTLHEYEKRITRTKSQELQKLLAFGGFLAPVVIAPFFASVFTIGTGGLLFALSAFNIVYNLYPLMVQRYNRHRAERGTRWAQRELAAINLRLEKERRPANTEFTPITSAGSPVAGKPASSSVSGLTVTKEGGSIWLDIRLFESILKESASSDAVLLGSARYLADESGLAPLNSISDIDIAVPWAKRGEELELRRKLSDKIKQSINSLGTPGSADNTTIDIQVVNWLHSSAQREQVILNQKSILETDLANFINVAKDHEGAYYSRLIKSYLSLEYYWGDGARYEKNRSEFLACQNDEQKKGLYENIIDPAGSGFWRLKEKIDSLNDTEKYNHIEKRIYGESTSSPAGMASSSWTIKYVFEHKSIKLGKESQERLRAMLDVCLLVVAYKDGERIIAHFEPLARPGRSKKGYIKEVFNSSGEGIILDAGFRAKIISSQKIPGELANSPSEEIISAEDLKEYLLAEGLKDDNFDLPDEKAIGKTVTFNSDGTGDIRNEDGTLDTFDLNPPSSASKGKSEAAEGKPSASPPAQAELNAASPLVEDEKGGIDMRSLAKHTKIEQINAGSPVANRALKQGQSPAGTVPVSDKEWQEIERMASSGIAPSCERIREYLLSLQDPDTQIDKVLACIAGILRQEEEKACGTESSLKEILVLLESDKPTNELRLALTKIQVIAKEPQLIAQ